MQAPTTAILVFVAARPLLRAGSAFGCSTRFARPRYPTRIRPVVGSFVAVTHARSAAGCLLSKPPSRSGLWWRPRAFGTEAPARNARGESSELERRSLSKIFAHVRCEAPRRRSQEGRRKRGAFAPECAPEAVLKRIGPPCARSGECASGVLTVCLRRLVVGAAMPRDVSLTTQSQHPR
eukprot:scaffold529_cov308-Pinguiococcus_pyrenoidosus.AAC.13